MYICILKYIHTCSELFRISLATQLTMKPNYRADF